MMYNQKMVAAIKVNGKICRENQETVMVPFGSEYSILIKNLNSLRAIVNITIDGTDAVPGGLVVNANQEIDLERFVKDMSNGNKFKFIERSASVEAGRGVKTEDGLIRISFKYAKPEKTFTVSTHWGQHTLLGNTYYPPGVRGYTPYTSTPFGNASPSSPVASTMSGVFMNNVTASSATSAAPQQTNISSVLRSNDVGITVPGSHSSQKFQVVADFATEAEEHVIVLKILGETAGGQVVAPVTVKAKPKCTVCNKINKATSKFCSNCGCSLEIWG